MKNKSNKSFFVFLIYCIIYLPNIIICYSGKCLFYHKSSKIIDFHKFKNIKPEKQNIKYNESKNYYWLINFCNDTVFPIYYNSSIFNYNSQIVCYKKEGEGKGNAIRLTGPFHKYAQEETMKNKLNNISENVYNYTTQKGDKCKENIYYSTYILFNGTENIGDKLFVISDFPTSVDNCNNKLEVKFNKEKVTDYLILQQVLNDGYMITGILFILLGFYLCFLSFKFLPLTKIVISLIFGQIIMFSIDLAFIGNSTALKDKLFILIIILGLLIGGVLGCFSLNNNKLYLFLLSFCSGFVNGIFVFDMCFVYTNSALTIGILIDTILIFSISFIGLMKILPKNYIFYAPIIGSYILIRGISLLIYNIFNNKGFIDLQLLLYLINRYENDLAQDYLDNDFKYFWVYILIIVLILIVSEFINYIFYKNNEEFFIDNNEEEDEDNFETTTELTGTSFNINDSNSKEKESNLIDSNLYN